jgi:hypothetical protein
MSGLFDSVAAWQRRRRRAQRAEQAKQWPVTQGEVNHWEVQPAEKEFEGPGTPFQIEAGFHFTVNGEYFGGYLRSVAMTHHEAEVNSRGNPAVRVRYNPANPDEVAVLAEDNSALPFRIVSG